MNNPTNILDTLTTTEAVAYGGSIITYLGIQGSIVYHAESLSYNLLHTAAILSLASFLIALSGMIIYFARMLIEGYQEYCIQKSDKKFKNNNAIAAVFLGTVIARLILITGFACMAVASYQNAVGYNELSKNFPVQPYSKPFTTVGIILVILAFIFFMFAAIYYKTKKDKFRRNESRSFTAMIASGVLCTILGTSLILSAQVKHPMDIQSAIPINVTQWITLACMIIGFGILIGDFSQCYLNYKELVKKQPSSQDINEFNNVGVGKKLIIKYPLVNWVIPGFTFAGVAFTLASAILYDSPSTLNPKTTNLFKGSYGMLATGITCFAISFALKFISDFSRHDDCSESISMKDNDSNDDGVPDNDNTM